MAVITSCCLWQTGHSLQTSHLFFQTMTPDDTKPVNFTVKAPVYLQIGDTKADTAHSGVCVVDVNLPFGKPVNVSKRRELPSASPDLLPTVSSMLSV